MHLELCDTSYIGTFGHEMNDNTMRHSFPGRVTPSFIDDTVEDRIDNKSKISLMLTYTVFLLSAPVRSRDN
jgi:hypothetical protein